MRVWERRSQTIDASLGYSQWCEGLGEEITDYWRVIAVLVRCRSAVILLPLISDIRDDPVGHHCLCAENRIT